MQEQETVFNSLLARSRHRPGVSVETWRRDAFSDARLRELHAFSDRLMAEAFEHFRQHALTNDVVHVFRCRDTGEVVGFQFWRTADMSLPRSRVILGGKLRMDPAFRNRGLHLLSGLAFFLRQKLRHPFTRYYRLSIASVFGFVSIAEALHDYRFVKMDSQDREEQAVVDSFRQLAKQNDFQLDERSGLMAVNIFMTPETLQGYPRAWFERPAARTYATANPGFRTNGCFVNFWFRFTPRNLYALVSRIMRKLG
ncbi:MAG: hypothetical protein KY410_07675 [Proteobacteria bacterium]|nr:hypothetical protein [Pseudomonadota bacterium]